MVVVSHSGVESRWTANYAQLLWDWNRERERWSKASVRVSNTLAVEVCCTPSHQQALPTAFVLHQSTAYGLCRHMQLPRDLQQYLSCFSSCSALHVPFALYDWIQDVNLDSFCVELLQQSAEVGPARVSFDDVRNPFPLSFRHAISVSAHVLHFIWSCLPCGCQIHVCVYVCMYVCMYVLWLDH